MATTTKSCSTAAIIASKSLMHTMRLVHRDFNKWLCQKVLQANGLFNPK